MPIFNHVSIQASPAGLAPTPMVLLKDGPFLPVEVSVAAPLAAFLTAQGNPVPPPVAGTALIDTGAGRSCADNSVIKSLGIQPISVVPVGTAGGPSLQGTFAAHFRFPTFANMEIDFGSVLGASLSGQTINGMPLIVLIGRDLLARNLFVYNGQTGAFSWSM